MNLCWTLLLLWSWMALFTSRRAWVCPWVVRPIYCRCVFFFWAEFCLHMPGWRANLHSCFCSMLSALRTLHKHGGTGKISEWEKNEKEILATPRPFSCWCLSAFQTIFFSCSLNDSCNWPPTIESAFYNIILFIVICICHLLQALLPKLKYSLKPSIHRGGKVLQICLVVVVISP